MTTLRILRAAAWADEVAKRQNIKLPPQPCGYCTWYHARASSEQAMIKQTEIAAKLNVSPPAINQWLAGLRRLWEMPAA